MNKIPSGYSLADIHIHSDCSDGLDSVKTILDKVKDDGFLSIVCVTDHDTLKGSEIAWEKRENYSFEIIKGVEVMSGDGEIIGLFINKNIPKGLSGEETIKRIHNQNGLAIATHPFVFPYLELGGKGVGFKARKLDLDGVEMINGGPLASYSNFFARFFTANWVLLRLGGSDSHLAKSVGSVVTIFPGETAEDFRKAILENTVIPVRLKPILKEVFIYGTHGLNFKARIRRRKKRCGED
ncbi:MAG: PHP domain-containing protein [Patescibacteria group bacterium]|nr:PHP domain-containing protein [Patescibacteria group bacterium]